MQTSSYHFHPQIIHWLKTQSVVTNLKFGREPPMDYPMNNPSSRE